MGVLFIFAEWLNWWAKRILHDVKYNTDIPENAGPVLRAGATIVAACSLITYGVMAYFIFAWVF